MTEETATMRDTARPEPLDLLAFGPHPDDAELFCGGLLIASAERGHRVGVVDLTRGELASNGTVEERACEAERAAQVMGLVWRENLGLPDGGLRPGDDAACAALVSALRRLRPALVLAPWRRARHPDHSATSALVERAVFLAGLRKFGSHDPTMAGLDPWRPHEVLAYMMRHTTSPTFIVDVSHVYDRKREAIACYASQIRQPAHAAATLIGAGDALEALEARDRVMGAHIGVRFAEGYRTQGALSIDDPVVHLRQHRRGPAHLFEDAP